MHFEQVPRRGLSECRILLRDAGKIFIPFWLPLFGVSPTPDLPEFDGKNSFVLWSTHWQVDISSLLIGDVGFPGLQQWADVPALNAFIHASFCR